MTSTDALKCIHSCTIDIAILDIEIDDRTGIDIARQLLAENPKCKIMFVTNYDSFAYSAFEIEAFSYLLKPFEDRKLWQQIDKILLDILKDLEKRLAGKFIRCHNGFIVNLNRITSYKRTELYVGEEEIGIPVSKANIAKVVKSLEQRIWENAI